VVCLLTEGCVDSRIPKSDGRACQRAGSARPTFSQRIGYAQDMEAAQVDRVSPQGSPLGPCRSFDLSKESVQSRVYRAEFLVSSTRTAQPHHHLTTFSATWRVVTAIRILNQNEKSVCISTPVWSPIAVGSRGERHCGCNSRKTFLWRPVRAAKGGLVWLFGLGGRRKAPAFSCSDSRHGAAGFQRPSHRHAHFPVLQLS
jgi:hypothetical protein